MTDMNLKTTTVLVVPQKYKFQVEDKFCYDIKLEYFSI